MNSKDKALNAFKIQVEELEDVSDRPEGRVWADFTVGIIKKYIGKDSDFLPHIESSYSIFYDKWSFDRDKRLARELLRKCIQYIELNGTVEPDKPMQPTIVQPTKSNFISRMSEGWAIFWAGCLITVFATGGYTVGEFKAQQKIDQQKIDLANQVKRLKTENSVFRMRLSNSPSKQKSSYAHKPNGKR